jgi:creatinine amidohydrolase
MCIRLLSVLCLFPLLALSPFLASAQQLSPNWEELTGPDFVQAIHQAKGTCILPIGIIEKHGPHLPLGTDLLNVRFASLNAAKQEYAVVSPEYYFGQIFEARHEPGTIAYSLSTQLVLLQETVNELSRNGCHKILIVNGHGGNNSLLPLFAQSQLASPHDYVVYVMGNIPRDGAGRPSQKSATDLHAGEAETSAMLANRPDLVHMDRAKSQSGADQHRLTLPSTIYTGIWWYARFPNHYAGDGSTATEALGEFDQKNWSHEIAEAVKAIKADEESGRLQKEFFEQAQHPIDTPQ